MKALMDELKSNGCILQGREPLVEKILAKHLENAAPTSVDSQEPIDVSSILLPELAETPDDAV